MPFITKQYKFCAAHRYWNADWSEVRNKKVFDKDIYVHGHNYLLNITIAGPIDEKSGFIINLKSLNQLVNNNVISILDHCQVEKDIRWFENRQPSTENMVIFIWNQISDKIPSGASLYCIKLRETPTMFTEYYGPNK